MNMISDTPDQTASDLSIRIQNLQTQINEGMEGSDIKAEMDDLKRSLMENPAACLLLKDEDIGTLVQAYRKIVGIAIAEASSTKPRKAPAAKKTKQMTAEELAAALDDPDF